MTYPLQLLTRELHQYEKILKEWPPSFKIEYSEAFKDRRQKVKQLKEAIRVLENKNLRD